MNMRSDNMLDAALILRNGMYEMYPATAEAIGEWHADPHNELTEAELSAVVAVATLLADIDKE